MYKQNLFLILFLVISCSQSTEDKQSPEATYIRLAEDLQVLAAQMERTLIEPELCRRLGRTAQEYAESAFAATIMVQAVEVIYDDLLNRR